MTRDGNGAAVQRATSRTTSQTQEQDSRALGLNTGWTVISYLIGGMVAYGAIGWLIGRAVHVSLLFPLGMLTGLAISLGFVIYRFGRQESMQEPRADERTRRGGKE